jgi:hypothetical protein
MSTVSAAAAFEAALLAGAVTAIDDAEVLIVSGYPYPFDTQDIVALGQVISDQEPATFGNRTRSEVLTAELMVSVFRYGGQETDAVVRTRARELLAAVEFYCRRTDTTLGASVLYCFLTHQELASEPFQTGEDSAYFGRVCEIRATFTAVARVTD